MLLLIDNYDSFTYNLVHYLGELGADVVVRRNDALDVQAVLAMRPESIVLSPGPCDPAQAGICLPLTAAAFEAFARVTFVEWTRRLPESEQLAFIREVLESYRPVARERPGEDHCFRFYQLDAVLESADA